MSDTTWLTELIRLREERGHPSTRSIAARTTSTSRKLGHNTIAEILRGDYVPPLGTLLSIVQALDGDEDKLTELWRLDRGAPRRTPATTQHDLLEGILLELREIRRLLEDTRAPRGE